MGVGIKKKILSTQFVNDPLPHDFYCQVFTSWLSDCPSLPYYLATLQAANCIKNFISGSSAESQKFCIKVVHEIRFFHANFHQLTLLFLATSQLQLFCDYRELVRSCTILQRVFHTFFGFWLGPKIENAKSQIKCMNSLTHLPMVRKFLISSYVQFTYYIAEHSMFLEW